MRASEIMTRSVITVTANTTVHAAAKLLADNHIGGMPVVDGNGQVIGIISEGDLLHRAEIGTSKPRRAWWLELLTSTRELASEYVKENGRAVKDVMSLTVISVTEDTPLADIADMFEQHRIKRVPVLKDGKLVGIVSRANLIRVLASMPGATVPATKLDDNELRDAVVAKLRGLCWALPPGNVLVRAGVVHLWGAVRTDEQCRAIEVAAESVPGVRRVESHFVFPDTAPIL